MIGLVSSIYYNTLPQIWVTRGNNTGSKWVDPGYRPYLLRLLAVLICDPNRIHLGSQRECPAFFDGVTRRFAGESPLTKSAGIPAGFS